MVPSSDTDPPGPGSPAPGGDSGPPAPAGRARAAAGAAVAAALAVVLPLALLAHITALSSVLPTLLGLWAVGFPLAVYRARPADPRLVGSVLAIAGLALGVFSFVSGRFNGLTDEPYMMPHFVAPLLHGQDPYATLITVRYDQYGTTFVDTAPYVYLPLMLFLQPFLVPYPLYCLAAWAGTIVLVRHRPWALIALGQPYLALLAANGFNDFPVLLLLTIAFVGLGGRRQRWAEVLSLGLKQFANVVVVAYYLVKRDLKGALTAVGVTVAFTVPFLVWNAPAFVCRAVLLFPPGCGGMSSGILSHFNYWVWPVWVLGVFFGAFVDAARRWGRRSSATARAGGRRPDAPRGDRPAAGPPTV
jgi:hypothetical protein